MCKCIYSNCQFEDFFQDELYYVKDNEKEETYCFFHAPEKLKEKFSYYQNKLFEKVILEYVIYCEDKSIIIDFSNTVFHIEFDLNSSELTKNDLSFNFSKTIFLKYFRMDNIKCDQLIFKDTEFHAGGGIKNRRGENQVNINILEFRPYVLGMDFVIDIGQHANKKGIISLEGGQIVNIRFENHKVGSGIIYFIGLNEKLENADFRNMILDNVSFQNCNLNKCYFLNSKVDKTEFRNCEFPIGYVYRSYDILRGRIERVLPFLLIIISISFVFLLKFYGYYIIQFIESRVISQNIETYILFFLLFPLIILYFFYYIANISIFIESFIAKSNLENSKYGWHTLNKLKFLGRHFSIADEIDLYKRININKINSKKEKEIALKTINALATVYIQLKENFKNYDYQMSGNFFYTQRYMETLTSRNKEFLIERLLLIAHHFVNGFGERFIKPLVWFFLTIITFAVFIYSIEFKSNTEFNILATDATPKFLLEKSCYDNDFSKESYKTFYIKSLIIDENKKSDNKVVKITKKKYFGCKLKRDIQTAIVYSASRFISPVTSSSKTWFKVESKLLTFLSFYETAFLLFFFGAFILALKNRIKR